MAFFGASLLQRATDLFRRSTLVLVGNDENPLELLRVQSGIDVLDTALGGGIVRGKIIEIFGRPGSGKTTLALRMAHAAQARGEVVAWVDAESVFDPSRAAGFGIDVKKLVASRPRSGEEALQVIDSILAARAAGVVVVDSVAGLVPRAELEAPIGESPGGLQARLLSQGLRRLAARAAEIDAIVILVNQQRVTFTGDGDDREVITSGGQAVRYWASVRIETQRVSSRPLARIVKNRFGEEGRLIMLDERTALPSAASMEVATEVSTGVSTPARP